jgi:hypothetical protein
MMSHERELIDAVRQEFAALKDLADRAAAQLDEQAYVAILDPDANSVALLMKHVGGNLRSRWTEPFTTDGEKPDRDRDAEFEHRSGESRTAIEQRWNDGWAVLFETLGQVGPDDLARRVRIRGQELSFARALMRSLAHTAGHVHQIVMLAKHWRGDAWETLSLPRKRSRGAAT